jgi:hypothetical protein
MPFAVRPTGDAELDRVQASVASAVAELERKIAALPTTSSTQLQQVGVAGTTTPVTTITVDAYGRVTHVA